MWPRFIVGNECGHLRVNGVAESTENRGVSGDLLLGRSWQLSNISKDGATSKVVEHITEGSSVSN